MGGGGGGGSGVVGSKLWNIFKVTATFWGISYVTIEVMHCSFCQIRGEPGSAHRKGHSNKFFMSQPHNAKHALPTHHTFGWLVVGLPFRSVPAACSAISILLIVVHNPFYATLKFTEYFSLTLSLPRVINFKFPLQPHQKYYPQKYFPTQYKELGFS